MVTVKKGSIDLGTKNSSRGYSKLYDDPIGRFGIVTSSFPTIIPGTFRGESSLFSDGIIRLDEVFGFCKPLIGKTEDFTS